MKSNQIKDIIVILKKSYDELPEGAIFSGYDYAEKCKKNGLEKLLNSYSAIKTARSKYLSKYAKRISKKTYIKKQVKKVVVTNQIELFDNASIKNLEITNAIELLKKNGYRIQKPITNYEEI